MSSSTVFSKSVLKTKKESKIKLLLCFTTNIIKKNLGLFFVCSLLAIVTAIINFNIGICFKNAFFVDEKTLSTETIKAINKINKDKEETIDLAEIKRIVIKKADESEDSQKKVKENILAELAKKTSLTSFKKAEAIELIEEASKDVFTTNILRKDDFKFKFNLFG